MDSPATAPTTVRVLVAADDAYASALAVTVRSAAENLRPGARIALDACEAGVSAENQRRLERSWADLPVDVRWLPVAMERFASLGVVSYFNRVIYVRLLAAELTGPEVDRAIYLDSDLLVRGDLTELWETPLAERLLLAVPDVSCPYFDSRLALPNWRRCAPWMSSLRPVANHAALGLGADSPYFNSGVLVMNLAEWRRRGLGPEFLRCLERHADSVWCPDQYALNVVLAGQWGALPWTWNQVSNVHRFPDWTRSPLDQEAFRELREAPKIVHFTGFEKPWQPFCRHPSREAFYDVLDRTAWAGWRPPRVSLWRERKYLRKYLRFRIESLYSRVTQTLHGWSRPRPATGG